MEQMSTNTAALLINLSQGDEDRPVIAIVNNAAEAVYDERPTYLVAFNLGDEYPSDEQCKVLKDEVVPLARIIYRNTDVVTSSRKHRGADIRQERGESARAAILCIDAIIKCHGLGRDW